MLSDVLSQMLFVVINEFFGWKNDQLKHSSRKKKWHLETLLLSLCKYIVKITWKWKKQAGAELGQAQFKLRLAMPAT